MRQSDDIIAPPSILRPDPSPCTSPGNEHPRQQFRVHSRESTDYGASGSRRGVPRVAYMVEYSSASEGDLRHRSISGAQRVRVLRVLTKIRERYYLRDVPFEMGLP